MPFSFHSTQRLLIGCLGVALALGPAGCSENPVGPSAAVAEVRVTVPAGLFIGAEGEMQAAARAFDASGVAVADAAVVWSVSEPGVVSVSPTGRVTAVGFGTALVTATAGGVRGQAAVEVYPATGDGIASVDHALVAFMREREVPGGAFAIVRNGRLVMARGLGYRDRDEGTPAEPSTRFRIASISKSITAVAILQLVDEGRLSLDDRAFEVLADLVPTGGPADPRLLDITIDHLLHHTGGWDNTQAADPMFNQRAVAAAMGVPSPPSARTIVAYVATRPLQFAPGGRYAYHNVSYLVLGRVIEAVTGQAYEDYAAQAILAPMGITRMQIGATRLRDRAPGEATYYHSASATSVFAGDVGPVPVPYGAYDIVPMDSHGGWISSVVDLARFGARMDNEPTVPDFLPADQYAFMRRDPGFGYGAGWFLRSGSFSCSGSLPGTTAELWIRDSGTFVAALLNTRQGAGTTALLNSEMLTRFLTAVNEVSDWPDRDLFNASP